MENVCTDPTQEPSLVERLNSGLTTDFVHSSMRHRTPLASSSPASTDVFNYASSCSTLLSASSHNPTTPRRHNRQAFQPDIVKALYRLVVVHLCLPFINSFFTSIFRASTESLRLLVPAYEIQKEYGKPRDKDEERNNNDKSRQPVSFTLLAPVHFCWKMALDPKLGLGESYIDGDWHADPNPVEFLMLLMRAKKSSQVTSSRSNSAGKSLTNYLLVALRKVAAFVNWLQHKLKENTIWQAAKNISEHYDLGNDLFKLFLDYSMFYSCAVFENIEKPVEHLDFKELHEAQIRKVDLLLEQLELKKEDRVLEIGCGWGSAAIRGVQKTGCDWTGITISKEQLEFGRDKVIEAGLEKNIDLRYEDYRQTTGKFSKILSIEMIEAVGHKYVPAYLNAISDRLEAGGKAAIQAILCPDDAYEKYVESNDFIRKHIFPGGHLPSLKYLKESLPADLSITNVKHFEPHYARTLTYWDMAWMKFKNEILAQGYSESFHRKWEFYFCLCIAVFTHEHIHIAQILIQKT